MRTIGGILSLPHIPAWLSQGQLYLSLDSVEYTISNLVGGFMRSVFVLPVKFKLALGGLSDIRTTSYAFYVKLISKAVANNFLYPSSVCDAKSNRW
jgi:hypothetical protein